MTEKKKNGADPAHEHDDAYRVDVPDDLLEEAVSAVERRTAKPEPEPQPELEAAADAPEVDVELEATNPEATVDLENMSVEEMMAGGFLPEKVVTAFNEANSKVLEAQIAAKEAREKSAALLAESDAFRKRIQREKADAVKFANEGLLKEFLPILDNLERALQHTGARPDAQAGSAIREGVEITLRQFLHVLQKFGVTRVPTEKGTPFNPHMHEAVQQVDSTELPNHSVASVFQSGFMLHERLLRPAMVAVARNAAMPAAAAPTADEEPEDDELQRIGESAPVAPAAAAPAGETEEEKIERIRRAGAAAREARAKKRAERNKDAADVATEAAGAAMSVVDETLNEQTAAGETRETPEEKLERIRRAGAAARAARQAKREGASTSSQQAADGGVSQVDVGFDADEDTIAEEADAGAPAETPEEKLERIRRVGAAAREARQQKKAERATDGGEAVAAEADSVATQQQQQQETAEEKLERIRRAGAAAREARQKRKEERAGTVPAAAAPGAPLPTPSFADEDLDDWESTVDAVRTDKQQGRR